MSNNRTFFKNAQEGHMTLRDIFSDVMRKHTSEESARVLIAGTALTTPEEADMLAGWQKPFLFARFGLATLICMLMLFLLGGYAKGANDAFLVCLSFMVPMVLLILTWEMNIPRSISLMEVLKIVAIGGILSLVFAIVMFMLNLSEGFFSAPIAEEPAKFAVVYILLKRKNRKYILEGLLLGMAVGTGFAIVETFGYIMNSAREELVDVCVFAIANNIDATYSELYEISHQAGMRTAVLRAANAFAGHGFYAALYSGGLMIAKGADEIKPKHLLSKSFLGCFAVSCIMHGANNSALIQGFFPVLELGEYVILSSSFASAAIAVILLLAMMKKGVNQVVEVSAGLNSGRVTYAVNRDAPIVKDGSNAGSGHHGSAQSGGLVEFVAGPLAGQTFSIPAGQQYTIGRAPTCSIPIAGASNVSSNHCSVSVSGSMIVVTDLGSTNGTYLDRQRLTPRSPTPVPEGGVVYLGNANCAFRVSIR